MRRTQPVRNSFSEPWFDACNRGRLLLQRCDSCTKYQFYPRILCTHCGAGTPAWAEVSGAGTVASFSIVRHAISKGYSAPYVVGLIQLAEGPRLMSNIVDGDLDALSIGMPVAVRFESWAEDVSLPVFTPVEKKEVEFL
ncbi:MAG: Zn-ribbon domain-containing OB-fold protein [Congregibacter sp.]